jgi:colicin import membrane protein
VHWLPWLLFPSAAPLHSLVRAPQRKQKQPTVNVKPAKHAPSTKHVTEQPRHNVKKQPSVKLQIRVTKTKEKTAANHAAKPSQDKQDKKEKSGK